MSAGVLKLSEKHLKAHDLYGKKTFQTAPIELDLPKLQGDSIEEHFHRLGTESAQPFLSMAKEFSLVDCPAKPTKWQLQSGWTKYSRDGSSEKVDYPDADCVVFDCEVLYKESPFAVIATAVSSSHWYGWVSPWLLQETQDSRQFIRLGQSMRNKLVIGHNVSYDRARIREEYTLQSNNTAFLDTMSLHVAVNGMCSQQRPAWMKFQKQRATKTSKDAETVADESSTSAGFYTSGLPEEEDEIVEEPWMGRSSINSLLEAAQFHCKIKLDKVPRDLFGELNPSGVVDHFQELMEYCATDVDITHRVFKAVLPAFLEVAPHPASFGAILHLGKLFLPINKGWKDYIARSESTYNNLVHGVQECLTELAKQALNKKHDPRLFQDDPWLSQLDWGGQAIRMLKPAKDGSTRPAKNQKLPGMPNWYRDLFANANAEMSLTVKTRIAPILLRLRWDGFPLVWTDRFGWTFQVDSEEQAKVFRNRHFTLCDFSEKKEAAIIEESYDEANADIRRKLKSVRLGVNDAVDGKYYFKIPHKDGPAARCGTPLAKNYLKAFELGQLSSEFSYAREALEMNAACSYWQSARARIQSQLAVWGNELDMGFGDVSPDQNNGMILPQTITMGTITRRAVENTWLTASNAKKNRVGSELKAMVQAPEGYKFVGADVDSEELWIASLLSDAQFGLHGATAIGWMTLEGDKSSGTDLHSKTAQILGISRDDAKVFNYGRIYGAGLKFAIQLLTRFNPSLSRNEAEKLATNLYQATKGQRVRSKSKLSDAGKQTPFWRGGTESFTFNVLEDIADQEVPRTPVLQCAITEALLRRNIGKGGFLPSRINWAIQSSGVDYLHLLIVSMAYLIRHYNIDARLSLTVHDEIRYLVADKDQYRAALALQISNLWTRALFCRLVGMNDVPQVTYAIMTCS